MYFVNSDAKVKCANVFRNSDAIVKFSKEFRNNDAIVKFANVFRDMALTGHRNVVIVLLY